MLNAAIYIRVSTERQVLEGYSLSAQEETLKDFASREGWNIYDVYADCGISGKNVKDRKEVKRLINDIKNNKIQIVTLYKFDRLTRDMRDTEDFIKLIEEYGITVYTLSGGVIDVTSPSGRFNTRILGAAAQFERENIQERIIFALREKVKKGYSLCSSTPSFGYNRSKHQEIQTINKKEANVVKRIFNLFNSGYSFKEISNILNIENIPTKKKSIWQSKTIKQILSNPTYIGKVRYRINKKQVTLEESEKIENQKNGFIANGKHEPIIDIKTWKLAQEKLSIIKKIYKTNMPKDNAYYCGFLICDECQKKFTSIYTTKVKKDGSSSINISYRCKSKNNNYCHSKSISHKKIERLFLNYLEKIDFSKFDLEKNENSQLINKEKLKKELPKLEKKSEKILKLYINNIISEKESKKILKDLKSQKNLIEECIATKQNNQKNSNKQSCNIKKYWTELSNKQRKEFLINNIKEIRIKNEDNHIFIKKVIYNE